MLSSATFRRMPIKTKLMVIVMVTTTAALLLAGIGIVASDFILFRRYLQRDVPAGSVAALDRPDPVTESPAGPQHLCVTGLVGAIPSRGQDVSLLVDHLDRR